MFQKQHAGSSHCSIKGFVPSAVLTRHVNLSSALSSTSWRIDGAVAGEGNNL